jgi:3-hydroxybutyryl-CoA dehydratase
VSSAFAAMNGLFLEDLKPGMSAMFGKTVTDADIMAFAGVSGDTNPIHLHDGFARTTRFGQRIAHGMLSGSLHLDGDRHQAAGPGRGLHLPDHELHGAGDHRRDDHRRRDHHRRSTTSAAA